MIYYVYVLRSGFDGRLYKGHTNRLEERVREHNSGKTKSTKGYKPWVLVYYEEFNTRELAITRERYFKSGSGREFLKTKIRPRGATEYLPAGRQGAKFEL
ncbi:GIY-YIG nuclease family protein [Joostella sp.]|uniref:GIY-YIG nuclease family protein n=1 Tax=Joostella sp. TaxID=2231138 RepID=UPI003A92521B